MKKAISYVALCSAMLGASQFPAISADERAELKAREVEILASVTASVEAVDQEKREVTLKGPLGNSVTFTVDKRVKRLKEVKVGDLVTADYYISIAAEIRKPTADEEKAPLVIVEEAGKTPKGTTPAAGGLRQFKVVTTVEGIDRPTKTVTVKGPMGRYLTARVADPSRLTELRIGETIVITYSEALAVSLEPASKKNAG